MSQKLVKLFLSLETTLIVNCIIGKKLEGILALKI